MAVYDNDYAVFSHYTPSIWPAVPRRRGLATKLLPCKATRGSSCQKVSDSRVRQFPVFSQLHKLIACHNHDQLLYLVFSRFLTSASVAGVTRRPQWRRRNAISIFVS